MRENRLYAQSLEARLLQTLFLLSIAAALGFSLWRVGSTTSFVPSGIADQYAGRLPVREPNAGDEASPGGGEGVDIPEGLPEDPALSDSGPGAGALRFAKTKGEMVAITHVHLFMIPLVFYLVGSLYLKSGPPASTAGIVFLLFHGAIVMDFCGMWLTRYVGRGYALLFWLGGAVMSATMVFVILASLLALWRPGKTGARA